MALKVIGGALGRLPDGLRGVHAGILRAVGKLFRLLAQNRA